MVSAEDRARLEAIVADRNRAQKHVARARIILGSAERLPAARVARRAGVGRPAVWRWQERFVAAGVDGLLRDATRKPGKAPLGAAMAQRVVARTCAEPPGEATHWTGRAMAEAAGISLRSVQRIWMAHDLQPHRIRTFKRSSDPDFAARLADIVGLYVDPPKHALVLSLDEKSQIQALDRTQPACRSSTDAVAPKASELAVEDLAELTRIGTAGDAHLQELNDATADRPVQTVELADRVLFEFNRPVQAPASPPPGSASARASRASPPHAGSRRGPRGTR